MRSVKLLVIAFGILSQGSLPLAAASGELSCSRSGVTAPLHWISSLEYDARARQVLIADPGDQKARQVLAYDASTGKFERLSFKDTSPTSLTKIQGGFLVKEGDNVTFLDPKRQQLGKSNLRTTKSGSPTGLDALYSNWVTHGSRFIGFGSVAGPSADPDHSFQLGFITGRITLNSDQPRDVKLLDKLSEGKKPEEKEKNDIYLLGFPYFAANDLGLFYVRMLGTTASIVQVAELQNGDVTAKPLLVFPKEFINIPDLPKLHEARASAAERFAEIEKSKLAVGLFGQGRYLYLLTREKNPSGLGTKWLLHQIDPEKSALRGTMLLPTNANFLSIAVAPDNWYIFEREEVRGWGDQDIKTLIRVPSAWISSLSSRLSTDKPMTFVCSDKTAGAPHLSSLP